MRPPQRGRCCVQNCKKARSHRACVSIARVRYPLPLSSPRKWEDDAKNVNARPPLLRRSPLADRPQQPAEPPFCYGVQNWCRLPLLCPRWIVGRAGAPCTGRASRSKPHRRRQLPAAELSVVLFPQASASRRTLATPLVVTLRRTHGAGTRTAVLCRAVEQKRTAVTQKASLKQSKTATGTVKMVNRRPGKRREEPPEEEEVSARSAIYAGIFLADAAGHLGPRLIERAYAFRRRWTSRRLLSWSLEALRYSPSPLLW